MRQRTDTFEELQFSSQIPWRLGFLREASMFAEAFSRALPLVFGPVIIEMWVDGEWAEASMGWGGVCSAYAVGLNFGGCFGRSMLRRRMRMSALQTPLLDSNLVRVARTVNGEAGAAFLVLGLVGLALSTLAIGLCRSVPLLAIARGLSGFCAGAIVGRCVHRLQCAPLGRCLTVFVRALCARNSSEPPLDLTGGTPP
jgi:MFS family permease